MREVDTVSRLGGDEFVVLLQDVGKTKDEAKKNVAKIAEVIRASLCQSYLNGQVSNISSSIGVTLLKHEHVEAEAVLQEADMAMYQSKRLGRNQVSFYETELSVNSTLT